MSERENIFARIREALTLEVHAHHGHGLPTMDERRHVMPPVGPTVEEQFALFAKNAVDLRAMFKLVKDEAELRSELALLAAQEGWARVATHKSELAGAVAQSLNLPLLVTDDGYDKHELEK